ncbi:MAG: ASCH domain-containing protein [Phycisphaeraceae bacterium]|nr:ASCH domain-containing protein [Phycisphaerales bacterium]MCB9860256.1 ASCH domain-containing protein [Phycisphaeraceae bacterium]
MRSTPAHTLVDTHTGGVVLTDTVTHQPFLFPAGDAQRQRALVRPLTLADTLRPERAHHVAIVQKPYLDLILSGEKTIEARLSKCRLPPFGCVRVSDIVALKQSSGPFRAVVRVGHIETFELNSSEDVQRLRDGHNSKICGTDAFWASKRSAKYATLMWIDRVVPTDHGPELVRTRGSRQAWFVLKNPLKNTPSSPIARIGDANAPDETPRKRGLIRARRA